LAVLFNSGCRIQIHHPGFGLHLNFSGILKTIILQQFFQNSEKEILMCAGSYYKIESAPKCHIFNFLKHIKILKFITC